MTTPSFPLSTTNWAYPVTRSALWNNLRQVSISQKETRVQLVTFPRYQWTVPFSVLRQSLTKSEFATLLGFVNATAGGALPFYYTDPDDNAVTGQEFGEGDGSSVAFQLVRTFGGFVEPVQTPTGTPEIYVAGVLKTVTTDYTIDEFGVVTFTAAPVLGALLTWTGAYVWLCRLDNDKSDFSQIMSGFYEAKSLAFTSIKL